MTTENFSLAPTYDAAIDRAAQIQYLLDCEAEYLTARQIKRLKREQADLIAWADGVEREIEKWTRQ